MTHLTSQASNTLNTQPLKAEILLCTLCVPVYQTLVSPLASVQINALKKKKKVSLLRGPKRAHPAEGDRRTGQLAN